MRMEAVTQARHRLLPEQHFLAARLQLPVAARLRTLLPSAHRAHLVGGILGQGRIGLVFLAALVLRCSPAVFATGAGAAGEHSVTVIGKNDLDLDSFASQLGALPRGDGPFDPPARGPLVARHDRYSPNG